ncbi:molybdenum cofactor guanylyltransferase [Virgibacillus siamensis]|uniref:molybdenum cofactor guanylyltransferase n=1 Tax=Virgibacillus siamensis TaxID=480071 RepID=UPI0009842BC0|nr:molybdenum cofactor guanylyltransferase [Virgibacillus siamensis]
MNCCGIILSGGKSSRMGTDKSLLSLGTKTVIEQITDEMNTVVSQLAIITNQPEKYDFLTYQKIADRYPGKGPLAGLETALYHIDASVYICAACDMPFIQRDVYHFLLRKLNHYDAVIPVYKDRMHPLSGIYTKKMQPFIQQQLENDALKVKDIFSFGNVHFLHEFGSIPDHLLHKHFFNMNHPEEYEEAKHF